MTSQRSMPLIPLLLVTFSLFNMAIGSFEPYQLNGGLSQFVSELKLYSGIQTLLYSKLNIFASNSPTHFIIQSLTTGLVSAIAGRNFAIIASDTRMIGEGGYFLESRNYLSSRLWSVDDEKMISDLEDNLRSTPADFVEVKEIKVKDKTTSILVGSSGCISDSYELKRKFRADFRAASYFGHISRSDPKMVANMLSSTLYQRRGFPYYVFCVLAALDHSRDNNNECCGEVYVYDAIGSYERVAVAAAGTGRELLQPILDSLFKAACDSQQVDSTSEESIRRLCKAYRSVSEREIGVGDKLVIHLSEINSDNEVSRRIFVVPLKQH